MHRLCILIAMAALSPAAFGQQYQLTIVEPTSSYPLAISGVTDVTDIGRVIGSNELTSGYTPFEWTQARGLRYITMDPIADQLNNRGDRVYANTLILADGTPVDVPDHQGGPSINCSLRDINDDRIVVGSAPGSGNSSSILVWDPVRGSRNIDIWAAVGLLRVNAFDQAIGYSSWASGSSNGFVCNIETGSFIQFNTRFSAPWSETIDVNELGVVVGRASEESGRRAFVWHPWDNSAVFLPGLDGGDVTYVRPSAIDNKGRVVGSALDANGDYRAFLWDPVQGMTNLHTAHAPPGGTFELIDAKDISETGVIIGRGFHGPVWGPERGFVLDPGETWADMGLALAGAFRPVLRGTGDLTPGTPASLELTGARPSSPGSLLVSWSYDPTRVRGGIVAALPAQIILPIRTDASGDLKLPFMTPVNAPSGLSVYVQIVLNDPTAPRGLAISNTLRGLVP